LILTSRNIISGSNWAQSLDGDVKKQVEKGKAQFAGTEIQGKTIGILGLGAIGRKVAVAANALGMKVVGYDKYLSESAKALDFVKFVDTMEEVYALADFITIHIPYSKDTHGFINAQTVAKMKDGVIIINAARGELVNVAEVKEAIANKKVRCYYTDFPDTDALNSNGILITPHLGASSEEAEENCAEMAAEEIRMFIEEGTIKNSVNMPYLSVAKSKAHRASVIYNGNCEINAAATVTNKDGISYAIVESDSVIDIDAIAKTAGVIKARVIF
ncbi:MAG TPA: NAD(P)-dependent oxidoreductase, partial [Clostridia bacterium]|nr:NAD(P)-dependent oxidoreductase [Clostridia bacterium]